MTRQLFTSLQFRDVEGATAFLTAVGFTEAATYRDDDGVVVHAEYHWRDSGGLMFGADRGRSGDGEWQDRVGHGSCYCVAADEDEVRRIHAAAVAAGATSVREPAVPDYGGLECAVRDAEGNQWSFGTYAGS
ncbi:MAG: VOC family protein [Nocardioides sp.]|uniref:VOC family protein n=1 Tax=Nocardioides sp. TaxID=35761 RepID=UPI003F0B43AC